MLNTRTHLVLAERCRGEANSFVCAHVAVGAEMASSAIADFYEGRSVFITGATGFMGKVLVEKLLRSCPKIACLYLLMRQTPKKDVQTRREELLNNPVKWTRHCRVIVQALTRPASSPDL